MLTRRAVLQLLPSLGAISPLFARALAQEADGQAAITAEMIANAEWVTGMTLDEEQRAALKSDVDSLRKSMLALDAVPLDPQADGPAVHFQTLQKSSRLVRLERRNYSTTPQDPVSRPDQDDDLAFLPVTHLSELLRSGKVTSIELTRLFLSRLKKFDPMLRCVVNLTEELALQQAERADQELKAGRIRGPLHGIPWGAKDLISVPGYPTTWGIPVFRDRVIDDTATVAARLEEAGAVLIGKLSLGAIAMGDKWFGGMTRNPWNPKQGSSGSSAGSASAASAGLVGFALGSETLGSILSPSTRCGSCGLRPTFGRVSRAGCMPLSYTMDKIGPLARSVEDLAIVFAAIHGPDGRDPTVQAYPFEWPPEPVDWTKFKVGVVPPRREDSPEDPSLQLIREMGCQIVEVELPQDIPWRPLTTIIDVEGAAVFNDLLRNGETEGWNTWTRSFQTAQFVTAIDYLKMQRVRQRLMAAFETLMGQVDILWNARDLVYTNFTGHPSVVFPYRLRDFNGNAFPQVAVATGQLFGESRLLAFCHEYQRRLEPQDFRPPINDWLTRYEAGELDENAEGGNRSGQGDSGGNGG